MKESVYNYNGNIRGGNFYRVIKIPYKKYIITKIEKVNEDNNNGLIKLNLHVLNFTDNKVITKF